MDIEGCARTHRWLYGAGRIGTYFSTKLTHEEIEMEDPNKTAHQPNVVKMFLSGPALERLIGGDTEMEMHCRQQIVDSFARRHLTSIANSEAHKKTVTEIRKFICDTVGVTIKELMREHIGDTDGDKSQWWLNEMQISEKFQDHLKAKVRTMAVELASQACDDAKVWLKDLLEQQKRLWEERVVREVQAQIQTSIREQVDAEVWRRLQRASEL